MYHNLIRSSTLGDYMSAPRFSLPIKMTVIIIIIEGIARQHTCHMRHTDTVGTRIGVKRCVQPQSNLRKRKVDETELSRCIRESSAVCWERTMHEMTGNGRCEQ